MANLIKRFIAEEEGLELLEYAILAGVLAIGLVAGYSAFRGQIATALSTIGTTVNTNAAAP